MWKTKNAPLLCRYTIDIDKQNKGYGQAALPVIVEEMRKEYLRDRIYLTLDPRNRRAVHIYEKFGFVCTGEEEEGEAIYLYQFRE